MNENNSSKLLPEVIPAILSRYGSDHTLQLANVSWEMQTCRSWKWALIARNGGPTMWDCLFLTLYAKKDRNGPPSTKQVVSTHIQVPPSPPPIKQTSLVLVEGIVMFTAKNSMQKSCEAYARTNSFLHVLYTISACQKIWHTRCGIWSKWLQSVARDTCVHNFKQQWGRDSLCSWIKACMGSWNKSS